MKIIDINPDWGISSDSVCVTIYKKSTKKKTGEKYYKSKWYYNNFVQALQGLTDRSIVVSGSFESMVAEVEELKTDIAALFKKVKGGVVA